MQNNIVPFPGQITTEPEVLQSVTVDIKLIKERGNPEDDGTWVITSDTEPGLFLAHRKFWTVCSQIFPVVYRLRELNGRGDAV